VRRSRPISPTDGEGRGGEGIEHTALDKHACAACGAQAQWHPERQALVCPHCGTVAPTVLDRNTGKVREIDLVVTLREMPDELRGWLTATRSVRCRSCQAISVFEPGRVGQNCEFCGSSELVDYEEIKAPLRPQSLLPFRLTVERAREAVRAWIRGRWLAPGSLKRRAALDALNGVYLPYWTFDAAVHCRWTAESGTYYYTTETGRDSRSRVRARRVRHVRWRPAVGELDHAFDDEPVPATRGVDHDLLRRVEPFPTRDVVPYDTAYLAGFVVEHYQVVLIEAAQRARESMVQQLRARCASQVPGDTHRNLQVDSTFAGETFKHVLVPVWLLTYRWGGRAWQVVINGATGVVAGRCPKSPWKIALLVFAAAAALALVAFLQSR